MQQWEGTDLLDQLRWRAAEVRRLESQIVAERAMLYATMGVAAKTYPVSEIATATGLTRPRVYQIVGPIVRVTSR